MSISGLEISDRDPIINEGRPLNALPRLRASRLPAKQTEIQILTERNETWAQSYL